MTLVAATLACLILGALAVFQSLLIAGRPLGRYAWGGQHTVLPRKLRIGSAISIALYVAFAVVILDRGGVLRVLPDAASVAAMWVLTGYFALGILMNGISRSRPERTLMTPVNAVLALLCLVVALG